MLFAALAGTSSLGMVGHARSASFQIVWVVVGDAITSTGAQPVRAGRHLFMAADLAELSLNQVSVNKVDVQPAVSVLSIGQRFCLSSLKILARDEDRALIQRAPFSVSVRQDQRDALRLQSRKQDICVTPRVAGEFPIRFTSMLPAPDGTTRVAQVYLRVDAAAEATASDGP